MLECARTFYNKRAVVKLEKHITSFCGRKEKKRYMILHTTRAALKETQLLSYNKTTSYFNGDKLHRYD